MWHYSKIVFTVSFFVMLKFNKNAASALLLALSVAGLSGCERVEQVVTSLYDSVTPEDERVTSKIAFVKELIKLDDVTGYAEQSPKDVDLEKLLLSLKLKNQNMVTAYVKIDHLTTACNRMEEVDSTCKEIFELEEAYKQNNNKYAEELMPKLHDLLTWGAIEQKDTNLLVSLYKDRNYPFSFSHHPSRTEQEKIKGAILKMALDDDYGWHYVLGRMEKSAFGAPSNVHASREHLLKSYFSAETDEELKTSYRSVMDSLLSSQKEDEAKIWSKYHSRFPSLDKYDNGKSWVNSAITETAQGRALNAKVNDCIETRISLLEHSTKDKQYEVWDSIINKSFNLVEHCINVAEETKK